MAMRTLARLWVAGLVALGIFGFNFLDQNRDQLKAATIDGSQPDSDSIASGSYPLSRPLYLKTQHENLVSGLRAFFASATEVV